MKRTLTTTVAAASFCSAAFSQDGANKARKILALQPSTITFNRKRIRLTK